MNWRRERRLERKLQKQRRRNLDLEAAYALGWRAAFSPEGKHHLIPEVGRKKALKHMAKIGSVRGMLCRARYHAGFKSGQQDYRYYQLWKAFALAKVEAQ